MPEQFDFYYKRSLREVDHSGNVLPLNFNVPLAYKSASLLWNMNGDILFDKWSRIEVLKALRYFWFSFKVIAFYFRCSSIS